jgi:hypothetical protein
MLGEAYFSGVDGPAFALPNNIGKPRSKFPSETDSLLLFPCAILTKLLEFLVEWYL